MYQNLFASIIADDPWLIFLIVLLGLLIVWLIVLFILNAKTRHYFLDEHHIEVRAGWRRHYIKVDGEIVDELINSFYLTLNMKAELENLNIEVRIGQSFLGNTISTKVNGKIIRPQKLNK